MWRTKTVLTALGAAALAGVVGMSTAQARNERPGLFDYYVLAMSWSPTYCLEEGARRGERLRVARIVAPVPSRLAQLLSGGAALRAGPGDSRGNGRDAGQRAGDSSMAQAWHLLRPVATWLLHAGRTIVPHGARASALPAAQPGAEAHTVANPQGICRRQPRRRLHPGQLRRRLHQARAWTSIVKRGAGVFFAHRPSLALRRERTAWRMPGAHRRRATGAVMTAMRARSTMQPETGGHAQMPLAKRRRLH